MSSGKQSNKSKPKNKQAIVADARKKDAMALAELIYDIFKEKKHKQSVNIISGQTNAQQSSNK